LRDRNVTAGEQNNDRETAEGEPAHFAENVRLLLDVFDEGTRSLEHTRSLDTGSCGWIADNVWRSLRM
jgi:hypothetical protein